MTMTRRGGHTDWLFHCSSSSCSHMQVNIITIIITIITWLSQLFTVGAMQTLATNSQSCLCLSSTKRWFFLWQHKHWTKMRFLCNSTSWPRLVASLTWSGLVKLATHDHDHNHNDLPRWTPPWSYHHYHYDLPAHSHLPYHERWECVIIIFPPYINPSFKKMIVLLKTTVECFICKKTSGPAASPIPQKVQTCFKPFLLWDLWEDILPSRLVEVGELFGESKN